MTSESISELLTKMNSVDAVPWLTDVPESSQDASHILAEFPHGSGLNGLYTVWDVIFGAAYNAMQQDMGVSINSLSATSKIPIVSFTKDLHRYGVDRSFRGAYETLMLMINRESKAGQAIIASLEEGANMAAMQAAGLSYTPNLS